MVNQKSNLKTFISKGSQLNFILITVSITGSLFYYNETFAVVDEIANKSSLNNSSSFLQIPGENNNKTLGSELVFSNVTNITNNPKDSVYAQIAANDNNDVYVVWQESVTEKPDEKNYDIFFTKSEDNGTTFSKPINLSNSLQNSNNQEISAFNENVYVVWQDIDQNNNKNSSIIFKRSIDSGNTFNDAAIQLANNTNNAYPKVNSYQDYVYIVWNSENNSLSKDIENSGLFFIKSSDKGNTFENSIRIVHNNFGESQISVSKDEVLIGWGGLHAKNIKDIYFVKSDDNGTSFTDPYTIQVTKPENKNYSDKINHPTNVEIAHDDPSNIVWQDVISKENQDIFIANIKNDFPSTKIVNLSNNTGISECPQIAVSNNHIYIVWEDITPGNHEILFIKGTVQQNN